MTAVVQPQVFPVEVEEVIEYAVQVVNEQPVVIQENTSEVITTAQQGPSGPPGQSYNYQGILAQEVLNGHRCVTITGFHGNFPLLGIVENSYGIGEFAEVIVTGYLEYLGWSWTPEGELYVLADGTLTQVPPTSGQLVTLGWAVTPTKIYISKQPVIALY